MTARRPKAPADSDPHSQRFQIRKDRHFDAVVPVTGDALLDWFRAQVDRVMDTVGDFEEPEPRTITWEWCEPCRAWTPECRCEGGPTT